MPTKDRKFTLKDYEQLIDDVLNPYFQEQNVTHDLEDLMKVQGTEEVPPELPTQSNEPIEGI